jgi:tRNA-2-methylthio-N6-dimethylallyladenosine synthase
MGNRRVHIRTFGCQMNHHDARRMGEVLCSHGFELTHIPEEADLIVINTCSVREKSYEKVLSSVGRYGQLKRQRPGLLLAVAGCVAQQEGRRLQELAPQVDLVIGPDHIRELGALVDELSEHRAAGGFVRTGFEDPAAYQFLRAAPGVAAGASALVTIQKGCDNRCAYCIVPRVRGPAVSRPAAEVVAEVADLVAGGTSEITLIGQNVNDYRGGSGTRDDFVELLRRLDAIPELLRLRFTTSHPKNMHPDMPRCFRDLRTLCPWLHLPVQAGSTAILRRMRRGYTREQYLAQLAAVRELCPEVSVGSDLIVGFPGETAQDFEQTLTLVEESQFDYAYSFKFSVRPETAAAELEDDVPPAVKERRLAELQSLLEQTTRARLARWVGRELDVLVEGPSRRGLPQVCGRAPGNQVVNIDSPEAGMLVGHVVRVRITGAGKHSLHGEPAAQEPAR